MTEPRPKQNETRISMNLQEIQHWKDNSDFSEKFGTAMSMTIAFALLANRLTRFTIFSLETEFNLNHVNNISRAGVALLVPLPRWPHSGKNLRPGKESHYLFLGFDRRFLLAAANDG